MRGGRRLNYCMSSNIEVVQIMQNNTILINVSLDKLGLILTNLLALKLPY